MGGYSRAVTHPYPPNGVIWGAGVPVGSNFAERGGREGGVGGGMAARRGFAPAPSLDYRCRGGLALARKASRPEDEDSLPRST